MGQPARPGGASPSGRPTRSGPPDRPGRPARPGGRPTRPGRPTRAVGRFRNLGFVAALVATVIAAIALIGIANLLRGGSSTTTTPIVIPTPIAAASDMTLGDPNAPVTVYEYSDFQCPVCRDAAADLVPSLDKNYLATGKAKLVFKNFAFIGQESASAAEAAECANEQGQFWEYYKKLYEEQDGENKGTFKIDNLKLFAQQLGLNQADFDTCLDSQKYASAVADDLSEGERRGVNGTPTFFVNQTQVNSTYDAIAKAIDAALATPTPPPATSTPPAEGTPQSEGTPSG